MSINFGKHDPADFHVYDTTMRDGAQQEGLNLSVQDKLAIARHLDDLGVGYIEGGWPKNSICVTPPWRHLVLLAGQTSRPPTIRSSPPCAIRVRRL